MSEKGVPFDVKTATKEELVAEYNRIAAENGRDLIEDFKTLGAGRTMLKGLIKAVTPKPVKPPRPQGVGSFAKELLVKGVANADVLKAVLEKFPEAKTTSSCIAYYKTKLIGAGLLVSSRAAKPAVEAAEAGQEVATETEAPVEA